MILFENINSPEKHDFYLKTLQARANHWAAPRFLNMSRFQFLRTLEPMGWLFRVTFLDSPI